MTPKEGRKVAQIIERAIHSCGDGTHKTQVYNAVCDAIDRAIMADEIALGTGDLAIALAALALLVRPRGRP